MTDQTARTLTPNEHDRAWHAIEGGVGEDGADPGTVLAAVLHALNIKAPSVEDEQAASPRLRDAARQAAGQPAAECACGHPRDRHNTACAHCPCVGYAETWPRQAAGPGCTCGSASPPFVHYRDCPQYNAPAVGQPAAPAEAHPPREGWRIEVWDVDGWMPSGLIQPDHQLAAQALAKRRAHRPNARLRLVRETTTWTVEATP